MNGLVEADSSIRRVRRCITRPADSGNEGHQPMTPELFERALAAGEFCLHWTAHGNQYGIPVSVMSDVERGRDCLVNLSREVIGTAARVFPRTLVLRINASYNTMATRLAQRGRETRDEISDRLNRKVEPVPFGIPIVDINNDGTLDDAISQALHALKETSVA